jgi:Lrp/AsnC family transcriptional regulator, regulator for asnA, asnC and gidA
VRTGARRGVTDSGEGASAGRPRDERQPAAQVRNKRPPAAQVRDERQPAAQVRDERPLDDTDRAIIGLLQHDGRLPYREIARQLSVAEGTVRLRVNRLVSSGALTFVAIADPFRLGYSVLAFSLLSVLPGRQQAVIDTLASWDEITYISSCTGRADVYAQLVCRDHDHLWELLHERIPAIGGITATETFMELKMHKVAYIYSRPGPNGARNGRPPAS